MPCGPCKLCGATNYGRSLGGPSVCPRCDAGTPARIDLTERDATIASLRADLARVTAEVEMLRGVGCDEDGDGPCGACLKCARRERDAARAQNRELRKVARAAAELQASGYDGPFIGEVCVPLFSALAALPPSMLEEPSNG